MNKGFIGKELGYGGNVIGNEWGECRCRDGHR